MRRTILPLPEASGFYTIECLKNGKTYVGSTHSIRKRFNSHQTMLRKGRHHCRALQDDFEKFGREKFKFTYFLASFDDSWNQERIGISYYKEIGLSYNATNPLEGCYRAMAHRIQTQKKKSRRKQIIFAGVVA